MKTQDVEIIQDKRPNEKNVCQMLGVKSEAILITSAN